MQFIHCCFFTPPELNKAPNVKLRLVSSDYLNKMRLYGVMIVEGNGSRDYEMQWSGADRSPTTASFPTQQELGHSHTFRPRTSFTLSSLRIHPANRLQERCGNRHLRHPTPLLRVIMPVSPPILIPKYPIHNSWARSLQREPRKWALLGPIQDNIWECLLISMSVPFLGALIAKSVFH